MKEGEKRERGRERSHNTSAERAGSERGESSGKMQIHNSDSVPIRLKRERDHSTSAACAASEWGECSG